MNDDEIYDLWMSIPSEGTPKVEICRFARALLAAGASEGQAETLVAHPRERVSMTYAQFTELAHKAKVSNDLNNQVLALQASDYLKDEEIAALRERIAGMEKDAGWISVDERLPTNDQIVAFVVKADRESPNWYLNGHVLGGTYHENWGFSTPGVGHRASHWMPLPEAPASSVASKED